MNFTEISKIVYAIASLVLPEEQRKLYDTLSAFEKEIEEKTVEMYFDDPSISLQSILTYREAALRTSQEWIKTALPPKHILTLDTLSAAQLLQLQVYAEAAKNCIALSKTLLINKIRIQSLIELTTELAVHISELPNKCDQITKESVADMYQIAARIDIA